MVTVNAPSSGSMTTNIFNRRPLRKSFRESLNSEIHSEILELTTASGQGKLQDPEELLPQASATPESTTPANS
jgi:hypothetical protein